MDLDINTKWTWYLWVHFVTNLLLTRCPYMEGDINKKWLIR